MNIKFSVILLIVSLASALGIYIGYFATDHYQDKAENYETIRDSLDREASIMRAHVRAIDSAYNTQINKLNKTVASLSIEKKNNQKKLDSILVAQKKEMEKFCEEMAALDQHNIIHCNK